MVELNNYNLEQLQRSKRIDTDNNQIKAGLKIKSDINLVDLMDIPFRSIVDMNYYPLLDISILHRIINEPNDIIRTNVLQRLTLEKDYIKPIGIIRNSVGVISDRYLRYYKYLKGMMVFMTIHTFISDKDITEEILSKEFERSKRVTLNYIEARNNLVKNYGLNFDTNRSILFSVNKPNRGADDVNKDKLNLSTSSYEDYLFFYYSWYRTREFDLYGDMFGLSRIDKEFEYKYEKLKEILLKYIGIFDIFIDTKQKDKTNGLKLSDIKVQDRKLARYNSGPVNTTKYAKESINGSIRLTRGRSNFR